MASEVVEGTLIIDKSDAHVQYEDRAETFTYEDWQKELKARGFLVMPTVTRTGALVTYEGGSKVGCLVPNGTRAAMVSEGANIAEGAFVSNFDHINVRYSALIDEGTLLHMPVVLTIESLVPPGTILWIKPDSQAWADMKDCFPPKKKLCDPAHPPAPLRSLLASESAATSTSTGLGKGQLF